MPLHLLNVTEFPPGKPLSNYVAYVGQVCNANLLSPTSGNFLQSKKLLVRVEGLEPPRTSH